MTTTILMVRHGAHDLLGKILCGRIEGVPLNDQGREQARAAARRLSDQDIAAVYSSPLERCLQTARTLADALSCPLAEDAGLMEVDFGAWSGQPFDTLAGEHWTRWNTARDEARPPQGESMAETQARVIDFLDRMRGRHPGRRVAAVSHADVIKAALLHVLDLPLQAYGRIEVDPGSVSVVVAADWGCKVHSINEAAA